MPVKTYDHEGSERQLLQGLRQRNTDALESLVRRYSEALTRAAYVYLGDAHGADDVVQETFIAAWDAVRRSRLDTRLRAWLFGILFNRCRTFRRSLWRRMRREQVVGRQRSARHNDGHEDDGWAEALRRALARLDGDLRAVLILRFEQGLSVSETAEALHLPQGTVKSRTHTATRKLKAQLRPNP